MEFFRNLFKADFMPHGHCYLWHADVLWTNVIGDAITALAYFLIPFALYYFVKKRHVVRFKGLFVLFATFIFFCGLTHVLAIVSVWLPLYRLEGFVKILTGIISLATAGVLVYHLPFILSLPSAQQMADTNAQLQHKRDELKTQNEFLRNLAYATYHDLREPVRSMAINSQMILAKQCSNINPETQGALAHIAKESKRMFNTVESILKFTFLESEKYKFENTSLQKITEEAEGRLQDLIAHSNARINCNPLPYIEANENLLVILFENIIANSIRFRSDADPVIDISPADEGECYAITFKDNGIGFDNQYRTQVFDMFKTLGNSPNYKGAGLGLAMAKRIVEIHGGNISAASTEGSGTTVTVKLPKKVKRAQVEHYTLMKRYNVESHRFSAQNSHA